MIIECATLLAIMGRYTRPQHRVAKRAAALEREKERERVEARWWDEEAAMGSEVGVQVRGNRVSYSVDCVHRFGDEIL